MTTTPTHDTALPHSRTPGTALAALAYPKFRILFVGMALSSIGTWMQNFTLPAYVDGRTGSAGLVGLLIFVQLGPLLVLSVPAGILADRFDRTKIVIAMQATMMAISVLLAVLVARDAALWTIFIAQLTIGIANTVNAPAFSASIPMLVDRRDLSGAISLNSAMVNGTRIAGPALAALLAAFGMPLWQLFIVNAATYLFLIVPLALRVRLPMPSGELTDKGWRRLGTGFRVVRQRGVLLRTLTTMFLFSLLCLPYVGLFPSVARLNFGLDPEGGEYKMLFIVWGLGAFFGALAVGTFFARRDTRRLIPLGMLSFAAALATFAVLESWVAALPVAGVLGFTYFMSATALSTVMQANLADSERGSTMPLWFMAFGGTVPIGNIVFGPLMDSIGARWVLGIGVVSALALAVWGDLKRLDEDDFLPVEDGGNPFRPVNANRLF